MNRRKRALTNEQAFSLCDFIYKLMGIQTQRVAVWLACYFRMKRLLLSPNSANNYFCYIKLNSTYFINRNWFWNTVFFYVCIIHPMMTNYCPFPSILKFPFMSPILRLFSNKFYAKFYLSGLFFQVSRQGRIVFY